MVLYTVLYVFLLVFSMLNFRKLAKKRIAFFFLVIFILLAGLRHVTVGTDTWAYELRFSTMDDSKIKNIEFGWHYLNQFVHDIGANFQFLLILTATLYCFIIYYALYRKSSNIIFSLFIWLSLYYYFYIYNGMRQAFAISFVLLAYTYLIEKRWKYVILLLLIGATFHTSIIFAIPTICVCFLPDKKTWWLIALLISLFVGSIDLSQYVNLDWLFTDTYSHYTEYINERGITLTRLLFNIFIVYIIYCARNMGVYEKILSMGVIVQNAFPYGPIMRVTDYYIIAILFIAPNMNINKGALSSPYKGVVIAYCIIYFFYMLMNNSSNVVPYRFF